MPLVAFAEGRASAPQPERLSPACLISPHCGVPSAFAEVDLTGAWWVHLGPIKSDRTLLALHPVEVASSRPPPPLNATRQKDEDRRRCLISQIETWPEHRGYLGAHLDYLAVRQLPSPDASILVLPVGGASLPRYLVLGCAWYELGGAYVAADFSAPHAAIRWVYPGAAPPSAPTIAQLQRLTLLLNGSPSRVGRPSRYDSPEPLQMARRAEAMKAQHPRMSWLAVARRVGVDARTLRLYRRQLKLDAAAAAAAAGSVLHLGGFYL